MSTETIPGTDTVDTVVSPAAPLTAPKKRGRPSAASLANLVPFNSERAKAISARANEAKKARAEMRRRLLAAAVEAGLESQFMKALKTGDSELMSVVAQASKLTGTDFSSSEEAVQNLNLKAETSSRTDATIKFVIEDAVKQG